MNCLAMPKSWLIPPPEAPPSLPAPIMPLTWFLTRSFIIACVAPLTTSCLFPSAAPPFWSKSLAASAMAEEGEEGPRKVSKRDR